MSDWLSELGLERCAKCGAYTVLAEHSAEGCAYIQKAHQMKRAAIEAGDDEAAVEAVLKRFEN